MLATNTCSLEIRSAAGPTGGCMDCLIHVSVQSSAVQIIMTECDTIPINHIGVAGVAAANVG